MSKYQKNILLILISYIVFYISYYSLQSIGLDSLLVKNISLILFLLPIIPLFLEKQKPPSEKIKLKNAFGASSGRILFCLSERERDLHGCSLTGDAFQRNPAAKVGHSVLGDGKAKACSA